MAAGVIITATTATPTRTVILMLTLILTRTHILIDTGILILTAITITTNTLTDLGRCALGCAPRTLCSVSPLTCRASAPGNIDDDSRGLDAWRGVKPHDGIEPFEGRQLPCALRGISNQRGERAG